MRDRTEQFPLADTPASDSGIIRTRKSKIAMYTQAPDFIRPCIVWTVMSFYRIANFPYIS
jgi:hypothetical protein